MIERSGTEFAEVHMLPDALAKNFPGTLKLILLLTKEDSVENEVAWARLVSKNTPMRIAALPDCSRLERWWLQ
jgi:hypothetical protein